MTDRVYTVWKRGDLGNLTGDLKHEGFIGGLYAMLTNGAG